MFCQNCGKQIPDTSKFCSYCGAQIWRADAAPVQPAGQSVAGASSQQPVQPVVQSVAGDSSQQPVQPVAQPSQPDPAVLDEKRRKTISKLEEMQRRISMVEEYQSGLKELDDEIEEHQMRYSDQSWNYADKRFHYVLGFLIAGSIGAVIGGMISMAVGAPFWTNLTSLMTVVFGVIGGVTKRIRAKAKVRDARAMEDATIDHLVEQRSKLQKQMDGCSLTNYAGFDHTELPSIYRTAETIRILIRYLEDHKANDIEEAVKLYKSRR